MSPHDRLPSPRVSAARIRIANGLCLSCALYFTRARRDGVESGLVTGYPHNLNRPAGEMPFRPTAHLEGGVQ